MNKFMNNGQWASFLFSPAFCFIDTLRKIRYGNIKASLIIPFIMGLFAFLFPPFSDFARIYERAIATQNMSLPDIIAYCGDIVLPTIMYYFVKFEIPIEIFRFIYTFYLYYLITKVFIDICQKHSLNNKEIFFVWVFIFMQIQFFSYIVNIRTIFVRISLFYCAYQYFFNNSNRHRYYSLLLIFFHYAYFPIILSFFISKYFSFRINRFLKIFIILMVLFGSVLADFNLNGPLGNINFGDTINSRIVSYTEGVWSSEGSGGLAASNNFHIYSTLLSICTYYLFLLFCLSSYKHPIEKFISILSVLVFISIPIPVLFGRYQGFLEIIISLYILYGYISRQISHSQMKIYLLLSVLNTALNTYAYWNCLVNGNVAYLLLPAPLAFFQTYNFAQWTSSHLTENFNTFIHGNFLTR